MDVGKHDPPPLIFVAESQQATIEPELLLRLFPLQHERHQLRVVLQQQVGRCQQRE